MPPASVPHWDARAFYPSSVSAAQQFAALPLNQTHFWISFYPWKGACATAQKPKTNMKTDWGEGCYICIGLEESRELQTAFIVLGSQKQSLQMDKFPLLQGNHMNYLHLCLNGKSSSLRNSAAKAGLFQIINQLKPTVVL